MSDKWSGDSAHDKACTQLFGYLVTFDFWKCINKERKDEWVELDGKRIFDVMKKARNCGD